MNLTGLFIRRPVMTALVMIGIILFGIAGYRSLPVSDLPNIDFPTLQVSAALPGANPETMASSVATPLERQFATVPGIDTMTSTSSIGSSSITIQFTLERDIDAAAQDVQNAIAAAARKLPPGMPAPPVVTKVNPADQPIMFITASSATLPLTTLDQYVETIMAQRMSMLSGVAQVNVIGAQKWAVHAQLDPNLLHSRAIGIDEVEQSLAKHNVNKPTGALWGASQMFTVQANGQLLNAEAYRDMIVAYRGGAAVRLKDLGRVIDGIQNDKTASWGWLGGDTEGIRNIGLSVLRQPGTNTVEVANRVKALLNTLSAQLPPAIKLQIATDRTEPILDQMNDIKLTLLLTIGLVILVIFIFLRNISATAIPSLALPISVIGTFAAMYALGYTMDNLSMMALTLSVGFVVDDAIVVLENIVRHMEMGKDRMMAAYDGAREIGFTVVSMTLSLAAVFIPVMFMSGIIGRLFHEFAVTIIVAILISGLVSVSLTPMLCSRYLRPPTERHGALFNATERMFNGLRSLYAWTLRGVMRHRPATLVVAFGTLVGTAYLVSVVPRGFIPPTDTRQLQGQTEARQDISFEAMKEQQQQVAKIVAADPNVEELSSFVGGNLSASMNLGRVFVLLKKRSERTLTPEQVIDELRPKLNALPGVRTFFTNPPLVRIGGQQSRSLYQVTLQADDTAVLYPAAAQFEQRMRAIPGIVDVNSDLQVRSPILAVDIDRDHASALGVTEDQIENALNDAYGEPQISTIYTPSDNYYVIVELKPEYQKDPTAMGMLYVRSATTGKLVPLNAVAHFKAGVGPLIISHFGQLPSTTLSFNLAPGVALGDAVDRVQEMARQSLPASITTIFQGTAAAFQSSLNGMGLLLAFAVLVIYMVLGILYESFIHPITILSGLPSAALGALLTLVLFHDELNIYSFVGVIMLIGIVKKNAIMMIDFAIEQQNNFGTKPADAIYEACLVRFRPIMMTSVAALMGTLPIALGIGAGGEARRPLGLAVVGGLLVSQLLTLYITPVVYTYMESFRGSFGSKSATKSQPQAMPVEAPQELAGRR
jgi:HAE1 family hydrophobic/amphiphilic exporter-1